MVSQLLNTLIRLLLIIVVQIVSREETMYQLRKLSRQTLNGINVQYVGRISDVEIGKKLRRIRYES